MTDWSGLYAAGNHSEIAAQILSENSQLDLTALGIDTFATIESAGYVEIEVRDALEADCGGGGYYRHRPPTIYLHPSIWRRDNFTLLHELGHHIQQHHPEWAYFLLDLPTEVRRRTEEAISNQIATQILLPWDKGTLDAHTAHPADVMAGLYHAHGASRSAVVERVKGLLPVNAKWILSVASANGMVQHAGTTYGDYPPKPGSTDVDGGVGGS